MNISGAWSGSVGLGIMSGTSMDGVDLAMVQFHEPSDNIKNPPQNWDLLHARCIPWKKKTVDQLKKVFDSSGVEIASLNTAIGAEIAGMVQTLVRDTGQKPDFIASHGQTVFHQPGNGYTTQLGDGEVIAGLTGTPTVTSFRQKNVTLGGQGAPLVPAGEATLFHNYQGFLNLGGIANYSVGLQAADVCFCNLILNPAAGKLPGNPTFDLDGAASLRGRVQSDLVGMLQDGHQSIAPGQSLSTELLDGSMMDGIWCQSDRDPEDVLASTCHFIAQAVTNRISECPASNDGRPLRILVTGGGARNKRLIDELQRAGQPKQIEYTLPVDDNLIDFKEAIIFAWLGLCVLKGIPNSFPESTGCPVPVCGGSIHLPSHGGYSLIKNSSN